MARALSAHAGKRAAAVLIDVAVANIILYIPVVGTIGSAAYWLLRDGMNLRFMDHRSVGKRLMKLRIVKWNGSRVGIGTSIGRNWMFAVLPAIGLPFLLSGMGGPIGFAIGASAPVVGMIEVLLVLADAEGRRIGDRMAGTRVVEADPQEVDMGAS